MDNNAYKSLAQKLMQDGILQSSESGANFFKKEEMQNPIVQEPFFEPKVKADKSKKRINNYDLELLQDIKSNEIFNFKTIASLKILAGVLNSKSQKLSKFENLFFKFFPKLYKVKLVKDALKELSELNLDAKKLLDKTIPYGEAQMRYEDLIKYISHANELQTNLKKKI